MATSNLNIKITTNANEASKDIKSFGVQIQNLQKPIEDFKAKLTSTLMPINLVASTIKEVKQAYDAYKAKIKELIDAYKPQWEAETKLTNLLKNTDTQLGLNRESLIEYAKELQNCTIFSDETVMSIESMLASTNKINDINLKRATESVLDISTAMGTDAVSASKTLAEVLKKPADELNKLKSVGIDFTDAEKTKITQLKEANKLFDAQKLVLDKVSEAYGGVAKAMADTPMGKLEIVENLKEQNKQLKGQIEAIKQYANTDFKTWFQEQKHDYYSDKLIKETAINAPDLLLDQPLDRLEEFYQKFSDLTATATGSYDVVTELALSRVNDAISKKKDLSIENQNNEILNRRGYSDEMYKSAVANIGVEAEATIDEDKAKEDAAAVAEEMKKELEKHLQEVKANITIADQYLNGASDVISGWCDFASQIYSNQVDNLKNTLSVMTSQWDEYYNGLKEKHESEGESLVSEYALGRISAEEYFEAQKAMNDELSKAEEEKTQAKEKAQAKLNEVEKKKFIADKANNIANATISMATGIMNAWTNPITAPIMTALIATTGIAQIATISAQQFTPSYASGAIVNKPTRALIGDSGFPEAVIPLNKAEDLGLTQRQGTENLNITINVENAYTSEDLAKSVYDSIEKLKNDGILKKETA